MFLGANMVFFVNFKENSKQTQRQPTPEKNLNAA
jgi:hypothetical protein